MNEKNVDNVLSRLKDISTGLRISPAGGTNTRMAEENKISLCMIVRDEFKNIDKCLQSFSPFVDEICIVDTGSKDGTVNRIKDLAKNEKHPSVKVKEIEWKDDFAAARNVSTGMASCNWIMWTDADDICPPETAEVMKKFKTQLTPDKAYLCSVVNMVKDKPVGRLAQVRLYPNSPHIAFAGRVHENVNASLEKLNMPTHMVPALEILHTGYDPSNLMEKAERNFQIISRENNRPEALYFMGGYYMRKKETYKALACFMQMWRERRVSGAMIDKAILMIGTQFETLKQYELAISWYKDSKDVDALFRIGECYMNSNEVALAKKYFEDYVNHEPVLSPMGNMQLVLKDTALERLEYLSREEYEYWKKERTEHLNG